jgi:hypothetical protein
MKYLLLGTVGCHLCEQAEELMNQCLQTGISCEFEIADIAEQIQWQEEYAVLIPVLLHERTNKSLNWPFTKYDVLTFIKQYYD